VDERALIIGGKPAADRDRKGLLKDRGGVEVGLFSKFREPMPGKDRSCVLNNVRAEYTYSEPDKELVVEIFQGDGKPEKTQRFDVKFVGKNITLRFREPGKTVVMTFAPAE
jgi:hypothetical protein